jgi:hypothetical protein
VVLVKIQTVKVKNIDFVWGIIERKNSSFSKISGKKVAGIHCSGLSEAGSFNKRTKFSLQKLSLPVPCEYLATSNRQPLLFF